LGKKWFSLSLFFLLMKIILPVESRSAVYGKNYSPDGSGELSLRKFKAFCLINKISVEYIWLVISYTTFHHSVSIFVDSLFYCSAFSSFIASPFYSSFCTSGLGGSGRGLLRMGAHFYH
jgi:hypothetical protein